MDNPLSNPDYEGLTRPIVKVWKGLIERAKHAKQRFNDRADQVMSFYSDGPGAMWSAGYMQRFMGGAMAVTPPKFKITLNLAFEQVAILGPLLFWEMADRKVSPYKTLQLDPSVLAGGDEQAMQYFDELAQQQAMVDARNEQRSVVLEHVLNYTQREQPGGGLGMHSDVAITETLLKGASFLRTEEYRFPFSNSTLVGSFHQSVDDVFCDPDCTDPLWQTADWIAIRHRTKINATEKHFGLAPGSLKDYATISSQNASYQKDQQSDKNGAVERDLVEWYEIFSRAGFGNNLVGYRGVPPIAPEFDEARGTVDVNGTVLNDDFVYLCICPNCPYPLNLCADEFESEAATPEWIKQKTDWPTEYWRDNKWPVEMLWFYQHSAKSAWPEPPLSPALGELTCLNILMSAYVQQAYDSRQRVIAYEKGAIADLQGLLNSDKTPLALELDPQFGKTVEQVLQFMDRPEANHGLIEGIQFLRELIEKRTGLREELYGGNSGSNPRSASEYEGKMQTVNIRPESMQKKVAAWHSRVADKEVFCLYTHTSAQDIPDVLGPLGMAAYTELVTNESPEAILRGSKCIVEASGIRRPNKQKDMSDLQSMLQYYFPVAAGQMSERNEVRPINGFIKAVGEAGEFDVSELLFPEPQPDEHAQQMQQAMQEAELEKTKAEAEKFGADAQKSLADAQATAEAGQQSAAEAQTKMQVAEHGAVLKQQVAEHQMTLKERDAQLKQLGTQQQLANKQEDHQTSMATRMAEARQKLGTQLMQAHQQLHQNAATHIQQTAIEDQKAQDDAKRGNLIAQQQLLMRQAEHDQNMKNTAQQPASGA